MDEPPELSLVGLPHLTGQVKTIENRWYQGLTVLGIFLEIHGNVPYNP